MKKEPIFRLKKEVRAMENEEIVKTRGSERSQGTEKNEAIIASEKENKKMEQLMEEIGELRIELKEKDKEIKELKEGIEEQWDWIERKMREKNHKIQVYKNELDYMYNKQKKKGKDAMGIIFKKENKTMENEAAVELGESEKLQGTKENEGTFLSEKIGIDNVVEKTIELILEEEKIAQKTKEVLAEWNTVLEKIAGIENWRDYCDNSFFPNPKYGIGKDKDGSIYYVRFMEELYQEITEAIQKIKAMIG